MTWGLTYFDQFYYAMPIFIVVSEKKKKKKKKYGIKSFFSETATKMGILLPDRQII